MIAMTVQPAMVNGIGITHGGAIFTLADTAFSLAANSYNERTVAAHCSIAVLRPTRLGDLCRQIGPTALRILPSRGALTEPSATALGSFLEACLSLDISG
jgi:acyl-CoA thioesterase